MTQRHRQGGWTFQGLLVFLLIAGFAGSVIAKLAPVYADHLTLKQVIEGIQGDVETLKQPLSEIRLGLHKKLRINNMELPSRDSVTLTKEQGTLIFEVDYEVRVPLYFNVDAVVYFDETYEAIVP